MLYMYFIGLVVLGIVWFAASQTDAFYNYDWSHSWSALDRAARVDANCSPIVKIRRKMGDTNVWVWTVPKSCEQGLPHTRSIDVIAIPEGYPHDRLPATLDHEKIHLLQRQMPESWARFYRIAWDYELYTAPPVGMPVELVELLRANPDTAAAPWCCWRGRWWSVPVYLSRKNLSLRDAPVKWWDAETGLISITPPEDWLRFFGTGVHQLEHPHEMTAEYLAGPLRGGRISSNAPDGMIRLRAGWTDDSLFPSTD